METPQILDCGHAPDPGTPVTVAGKQVRGWQFVLADDGRKICHACADSVVLDCGHTPSPHSHFTTGYGTGVDGKKSCYACCAQLEAARMVETGRATLYLTGQRAGKGELTDWPGKLRFEAADVHRSFGYGFGHRYAIATGHFTGPDGKRWSFRNAGDNQIARCRRMDRQ